MLVRDLLGRKSDGDTPLAASQNKIESPVRVPAKLPAILKPPQLCTK